MSSYGNQRTVRFITEVMKHQCLVDSSHPDYKNPAKRGKAWESVAKAMADNWPSLTLNQKVLKVKYWEKKWRMFDFLQFRPIKISDQTIMPSPSTTQNAKSKTDFVETKYNVDQTTTIKQIDSTGYIMPGPSCSQTLNTKTPQTKMVQCKDDSYMAEQHDSDHPDLGLVMTLLPTFKLLKEKDKFDVLFSFYTIIKQYLDIRVCTQDIKDSIKVECNDI